MIFYSTAAYVHLIQTNKISIKFTKKIETIKEKKFVNDIQHTYVIIICVHVK